MRDGYRASTIVFIAALSATVLSPSYAFVPVQAQAWTASATTAKIWIGHHKELEDYLRTAVIEKIVDVPIGVTKPKRAYFKAGGPVASAAWKPLKPGRYQGYWDSYKSEIAAYEVDKLLELDMVPVTVERRIDNDLGAAILWVEHVRSWEDAEHDQRPPGFERQVSRMKMFDNLIGNKDRNVGNLLVDRDWNLVLIDHSRAFIGDKDLAVKMNRIDRDLWSRMLTLDEPALTAALTGWVEKSEIKAILIRRDKMQKAIQELIAQKGEKAVFVQ